MANFFRGRSPSGRGGLDAPVRAAPFPAQHIPPPARIISPMKPLLFAGLVVAAAFLLFVGLIASRVMGKDVIKDPAAPGASAAAAAPAQPTTQGLPASPLDFTVKDIDGKDY